MRNVEELYSAYEEKKKEIKKRLNEFKQVKGDEIFYELCFCLLTPQSSAKSCDRAVSLLRDKDFLNRNIHPSGYVKGNARFHNNKTGYLLEMKKKFNTLEMKRDFLVKNVKGMGMKEASHFLRNIGYRNLAILDRHILKNLVKYGAIEDMPKTLTPKRYEELEERFRSFADRIGIPMDELDLLFWSMETGEIFK